MATIDSKTVESINKKLIERMKSHPTVSVVVVDDLKANEVTPPMRSHGKTSKKVGVSRATKAKQFKYGKSPITLATLRMAERNAILPVGTIGLISLAKLNEIYGKARAKDIIANGHKVETTFK